MVPSGHPPTPRPYRDASPKVPGCGARRDGAKARGLARGATCAGRRGGELGWPTGFEPVTFGATIRCSAVELRPPRRRSPWPATSSGCASHGSIAAPVRAGPSADLARGGLGGTLPDTHRIRLRPRDRPPGARFGCARCSARRREKARHRRGRARFVRGEDRKARAPCRRRPPADRTGPHRTAPEPPVPGSHVPRDHGAADTRPCST